MNGIDVSTYQGYPDWNEVRKNDLDFVIIKATQGRAESSSARMFKDSKFDYNMKNASKYFKYIGTYHYLTAQTLPEADAEADLFIKAMEPYKKLVNVFAAVDVESKYLKDLNKDELTAIVRRFYTKVRDAGYRAAIYTNPDWLKNRLGNVSSYNLWLARWTSISNQPSGYAHLLCWQWGSKKYKGLSGAIDSNVGYFKMESEKAPHVIKVGDVVRVENPIIYGTNKKFKLFCETYTVSQVVGKRAVITHDGVVVAAIDTQYLELAK